jgi:bifunctional UDP-N-acetylglucosamine pyrophosphorylase/glucosamine-1-phosphate N-acetyltransferase
MMITTPVLLAAGEGTRMKSRIPKILHPILGQPMVWYAFQAVRSSAGRKPVVVIGQGAEGVKDVLGNEVEYCVQVERLGTGHAVQQTESLLRGKTDNVLVTYGDMPLIKSNTLERVVASMQDYQGPLSMLTVMADDPRGFGRIIRGQDGNVIEIVEEIDASPEQLAVRELNPGVYCFNSRWLWESLKKVQLSSKGEYYLTDLVSIAVNEGHQVQTITVSDRTEMIGINTRAHLAEVALVMQDRINQELMSSGVSIIDPHNVYIEPGIKIGQDTVIWPNTFLQGNTVIGEECVIGPNSVIRDTSVGDRCVIFSSVLEGAELENDVDIGPFSHLRKGAHLAQGVHMGNFGEVKNSYLGAGTKLGHFSYLGDATVGPNVNIGAGTITCNFDGEKKNPTEIGANAFLGSDTMLVAPLTVGEGARTGAGAVVTKDIPDHTLSVGMPARAIRKLDKKEDSD